MKMKKILIAALAVASFGAHAALTTLSAPYWTPTGSTGLETVQFNVNSGASGLVALGAHAYKNGPLLPNDGVSVFNAQSGVYTADGSNYANWSFDFSYAIDASCVGCTAWLRIDTDPSAGVNFQQGNLSATLGAAYKDSWNMEMGFLGLTFDPFAASSTDFQLVIKNASGADVLGTGVTVNVPEPGTLALAGLALAGLGVARRRRN
jgi:hypothetical protein